MLSRWLIALAALLITGSVWILMNPSYQKSIESRVLYGLGDYERAYELAKESFELDSYNRMASTIMVQSQTALKFVRYNEDAERYKKEIRRIADQKSVTPAERAKIRMITSIMIDSYRTIAPTVITDEALIEQSRSNYTQFKTLHDELALPK